MYYSWGLVWESDVILGSGVLRNIIGEKMNFYVHF